MAVLTKEDYDEMQKQLAEKVPTGKVGRPSPRTLGKTVDPVTKKEVFFTKFGTQQLKFIDPAKPALGVRQINVGQTFKGFTTAPVQTFKETFGFSPFGAPTVRDTAYPDLTITKGVGTTTPPPFPPDDNGEECDLGCLMTFRGCDCGCKDVKPCTTCDSTVCAECNAWDLQCEDCRKKDGTCTPPVTPPTPTCECEACKNGTGECSDKKPCCNAWDILCEMGGECSQSLQRSVHFLILDAKVVNGGINTDYGLCLSEDSLD